MKTERLNNHERELWIANDESLYRWQRQSRLSMRNFIKQNREEIDRYINAQLNKKPIN